VKRGRTIDIQGTLLDYFSDESLLNTLVLSRSSTQFTSYAPDSLNKLGGFWIDKRIGNYSTYIDEDFFFLPSGNGELVAIDKFSGIEMVLFDLGAAVSVGVCDSPGGLFVLTGTPINNGKSIDIDLCVCLCDKITGQKQFQSQSMDGNFLPMVFDENLWVLVGKTIYKYSSECELRSKADLKITPKFPVVVSENYVAVASDLGAMEIFSRNNLQISSRILVKKNSSPPIKTGYDRISWFAGSELYSVDLSTGHMELVVDLKSNIASTPLYEKYLFVCDEIGNLIRINLEEKTVKRLHLGNQPLWKPVLCDKYIFVAAKNKLYQIEV